MPFTPFHLGPGLLIKGLIPDRFSISMYALANAAMDVEPLFHLLRGDAQLHGVTHTFVGAGLIGAGTALLGRIAIRRTWQAYEYLSANPGTAIHATWAQAWANASLGTFSHLLMDAVMHADMHPFLPLVDANPWLDVVSTELLHLASVVTGMIGVLLILIRAVFPTEHSH